MSCGPDSPIQRRWRELQEGTPREIWFEALHDAIRESYLAEPENAYRGSGRSRGAERWIETRRLLADGIDRSGDYLDVGSANGLLLESMVGWARERGHALVPHGIDFVAELVGLSQQRHPEHARNFSHANVLTWRPTRRYDWVRTNLEYVPRADRAAMVLRLVREAVAPDGVLVLCHYRNRDEPVVDCRAFAERLGLGVERQGRAPGVDVAWVRAPS